jgi:Tfp pilus assembly protein FimT
MMLPKHVNIKTLIFILLPIAVVSVVISWDLQRLDNDFTHLYSLLKTARLDAFYKDTTSMTSTIPMIARVDYDTVMGNSMIVYTGRGTSDYNKRVHRREIMLKSLLGFRRYLHVNCNGLVTEGRYPEDV